LRLGPTEINKYKYQREYQMSILQYKLWQILVPNNKELINKELTKNFFINYIQMIPSISLRLVSLQSDKSRKH